MTSRRKGRKNKSKSKSDDFEKQTKYNPYAFFSAEEISQIKGTLKIKDVVNFWY